MTMKLDHHPSPAIADPIGTYTIGYYADGALDLLKIIGTATDLGDDMWHIEADYPHLHTGKLFITSSAYSGRRKAVDKDFRSFIIEQKESLIDLRNRPPDKSQDMRPWFKQGIRIAYRWWKDYRRRRGLKPPPELYSLKATGGKYQ